MRAQNRFTLLIPLQWTLGGLAIELPSFGVRLDLYQSFARST